MISIYTYIYNVLSQGYPFLESLCSVLSLGDEVVIVDCGSNDGSFELAQSLSSPYIKVAQEPSWVNGLGGRNHHLTGSRCHELCSGDTILFIEADEVWTEKLVGVTRLILKETNNLKFWRYQITQNFQRVFWYPEKAQQVHRIFPRGSTIMRGGDKDIFDQDNLDAQMSYLVSNDNGYIIDCRNNFRDHYMCREEYAKAVWSEESRVTTRLAPAHAAYQWECNPENLEKEFQDERWLWTHSILDIPPILRYHLGHTKYEVRNELVTRIKEWCPDQK